MANLYVIKGKYGNEAWEDIDQTEDYKNAKYLLGEYRLAYKGMNYQVKMVTRRVKAQCK